MKYHRHPRFFMTDKDKKWGLKKREGGEKTTYIPHKLKIDLETNSQKKKKPQQKYIVFCCGCH